MAKKRYIEQEKVVEGENRGRRREDQRRRWENTVAVTAVKVGCAGWEKNRWRDGEDRRGPGWGEGEEERRPREATGRGPSASGDALRKGGSVLRIWTRQYGIALWVGGVSLQEAVLLPSQRTTAPPALPIRDGLGWPSVQLRQWRASPAGR
ncbi:hypothetical protein VTN96DRAFT_2390 [Rasamsonia emersonii]